MKVKLSFNDRLNMLISNKSSLLCIGLDPVLEKLPSHLRYEKNPLLLFNREIVEATSGLAVAYKANLAFYECEGINGLEALQNLSTLIPKDVILILDGKRGDISNTANKYVKAYFKEMNADAVTVNPYMGYDAIEPFIMSSQKGIFILTLTSNPGANDFQNLQVGKDSLYQYIARRILKWNKNNNCGAVVGATYPSELKIIRNILGEDIPLLIPGLGKQGGDVEKTVKNGTNTKGEMAIINSSRGIIYAGKEENFSEKSRDEALFLRNEINKYK